MGTKTFSGRADENRLAFADAITQRDFGQSFGQYCATTLIDALHEGADLPRPSAHGLDQRTVAVENLKALSSRFDNLDFATLTDAQIRDMIAGKYA